MEIIFVAEQILDQLKKSIEQIDQAHFSKPCPILSNSTIGQHVRHTLEFFICLSESHESGSVDYDSRKRDKQIEEDKFAAIRSIDQITIFLKANSQNQRIQLVAQYDEEGKSGLQIDSNYYRELAYNIEHAIHHMALIKIGINNVCPYVILPEGYGVASSTIRHQREILS